MGIGLAMVQMVTRKWFFGDLMRLRVRIDCDELVLCQSRCFFLINLAFWNLKRCKDCPAQLGGFSTYTKTVCHAPVDQCALNCAINASQVSS